MPYFRHPVDEQVMMQISMIVSLDHLECHYGQDEASSSFFVIAETPEATRALLKELRDATRQYQDLIADLDPSTLVEKVLVNSYTNKVRNLNRVIEALRERL